MGLSGWRRAERSDPYYKACVATFVGGGAVAGNIVGGFAAPVTGGTSFAAVPVGIAMGFVAGFLLCPDLAPRAREQLERGFPLSKADVKSAAEAMGRYASVYRADEALKLLALARFYAPRANRAQCNMSGGYVARQILASA